LISAASAEVISREVTVSPGSPSFSMDFGEVKPGDALSLTIIGLPEGLDSATATPSEGDVAWTGGLQRKCGQAVFTSIIPTGFSGNHTGNFSGTFCLSGDGDGPVPTWSGDSVAQVCSFDRIEINGEPDTGGTTPHGSQSTYTVKAYDDESNDITDKVDFTWKKIEYPFGQAGSIETDLGSGSSKEVNFQVVATGVLTEAECASPSAITLIIVEATYCDEDRSAFVAVNVAKGVVEESIAVDEIVSDATGAFQDVDIGTPVVVPKTPVKGSVIKVLSGTFTLQGSVTVSGSAKGSVAPFGFGVEVTVGLAGTTTVSQADTESVSVTVDLHEDCDIRIRILRRVALREVVWRSITTKTYDTGYVERCLTGDGNGQGQIAEIRAPVTIENCTP